MILVFALIVVVNGDIDQQATSYWADLNRCKYFAEKLRVQGTHRRYVTPVTAYCLPKYKNPDKTRIHD